MSSRANTSMSFASNFDIVNEQQRLYIIGNGFDLYHDIKSRYSHFKKYVESIDPHLLDLLDLYFPDELWSDFERTLAEIDTDTITEDASDYLESYASDDWSESSHHNYQSEIQRIVDAITVDLKKHFLNWILKIEVSGTEKLILDKNSIFLNFNYTKTLEVVYQIEETKIVYIHNKADGQNSNLILGHGREFSQADSFSYDNDMDTDVRVAEGNNILDQYFKETYKDTESIIAERKEFFLGLGHIDQVFVLGHSLSVVDLKYFEIIKERVRSNAVWTVSYYGDDEKERHRKTLTDLGLKEANLRFLTLKDLL